MVQEAIRIQSIAGLYRVDSCDRHPDLGKKASPFLVQQNGSRLLESGPRSAGPMACSTWKHSSQLATKVDLMVIAPATADLIAKLANGLADDLVSTLYLQITSPILLAPAI